jgi:hypothetical protein
MPLAAAASVSVARVLTGPVRTVTVTASLSNALYVSTLDPDTPAVCLVSAEAIRVPCALILGPGVAVPPATVGAPAWLGEGRLGSCGTSVSVTRWWRPARARWKNTAAIMDAVGRATAGAELWQPAAALGAALTSCSPQALAAPVRALLGRGPGLTPLGDDVLAGVLVTLHAAGHPAVRPLVATLAGALAARPDTATTPVSAALLAHAGRGECIPQLAALLSGGEGPGGTESTEGAVDDLLAVGHSSGGGLLLGVRIGLEAVQNLNRIADRTPHPRGVLAPSSENAGPSILRRSASDE